MQTGNLVQDCLEWHKPALGQAAQSVYCRSAAGGRRFLFPVWNLGGQLFSHFPCLLLLVRAALAVLLFSGLAPRCPAWASTASGWQAKVELPNPAPSLPMKITADRGARWTEGTYQVWALEGNVQLVQGPTRVQAPRAIIWIGSQGVFQPGQTPLISYLEGQGEAQVQGVGNQARWADQTWLGRWITQEGPEVQVGQLLPEPREKPPWYHRAVARRRQELAEAFQQQPEGLPEQKPHSSASMAEPISAPGAGGSIAPSEQLFQAAAGLAQQARSGTGSGMPGGQYALAPPVAMAGPETHLARLASAQPASALPSRTRRIRVFSRSDVRIQAQWFPDPQTNQGIAVIDGGVNIVIDEAGQWGTVDISADRMVIWTRADQEPGLSGEAFQDSETPLEIYLEGNVVFRQGQRIIWADRLYYDVRRRWGTVLGAEVLTPAPKYEGLLRLRAEVLQQTGPGRFFAQDAFVTSSRLGTPRYRLQAREVYFEDVQVPIYDPATGQVQVDPQTGELVLDHQQNFTSRHNFLFLEEVPVLYWPWMAADLSEPTLYIRRVRYKYDKSFGNQVFTDWNAYQIFGIRQRPEGTRWDASIDYLDKRGLGHGTTFTYRRNDFLGIRGPVSGLVDYWGIRDHGEDLLAGRGWVRPESEYRYRLFWKHRQQIAGEYLLSAEVNWISDRNFLEQYYRNEWETFKDFTTGVQLRRARDHISWGVSADVRLNDFQTQTEWLPRADHFILGQRLAEGLTWFSHSGVGYGRFRTAAAPTFAKDAALFSYLPWESPGPPGSPGVPLKADGERVFTRQEIDWPLQLGPVKLVPYALAEIAHWGEDRTGDDLQRLYYQVGVRASLPFWRSFPEVESLLWNLHGLAHKVTLETEFAFAEANRDLSLLPLYDPLDDDGIEALRRRFAVRTFGLPQGTVAAIPLPFDERFYAVRTGLAGWVTAPVEVADDLMAFRLGMQHRLQTKRGLPENRRIIDWMTLDTNLTIFPDPDRDNFGTAVGLLDYHYRWFIGDRLTLVSTGLFDFFHDGAQVITIGGYLERPPRGQLYLGLNLLEGPLRSQVLLASFSYQMSPKWIGTVSASVDLTGQNIGQSASVTRIGESLVVNLGVSVDAIRKDTGVFLSVEPRFLPKRRLTGAAGRIPIAGLEKLE
ncbi:MAG: hypothetical protein RMI90_13805 [Thermoguttaceae bacterium]|nr:hypothetical protein [Thermoguttaceae bacterium]